MKRADTGVDRQIGGNYGIHHKLVDRLGAMCGIERFGGMMMKYKVGDEVLVKARITKCNGDGTYKSETNYSFLTIDDKDIQKSPDMTAEEAWEIAKKILLYPSQGGYNSGELEEIFGRTEHLWELTPHEAKAKIEAWEAEKEIKVGDVVKDCNGKIGVVISKGTSDNVLFDDGSTWNYTDRTLKKTGRHIDIEGLLKQIGGIE